MKLLLPALLLLLDGAAALAAPLPPEVLRLSAGAELECPSARQVRRALVERFGARRIVDGEGSAGADELSLRLSSPSARTLAFTLREPGGAVLERTLVARRPSECAHLGRTVALIVDAWLRELPWHGAGFVERALTPTPTPTPLPPSPTLLESSSPSRTVESPPASTPSPSSSPVRPPSLSRSPSLAPSPLPPPLDRPATTAARTPNEPPRPPTTVKNPAVTDSSDAIARRHAGSPLRAVHLTLGFTGGAALGLASTSPTLAAVGGLIELGLGSSWAVGVRASYTSEVSAALAPGTVAVRRVPLELFARGTLPATGPLAFTASAGLLLDVVAASSSGYSQDGSDVALDPGARFTVGGQWRVGSQLAIRVEAGGSLLLRTADFQIVGAGVVQSTPRGWLDLGLGLAWRFF